ncbi:hypothetical protein [Pseudomonas sp. BMS12]|uniref:hypothetical protein n=1 Tax=Pseudomonas sp. BMS12 TaxID=1796033 RepID=UPI0012905271|nr:hypothetical protein [Pseudomonas sp. BMS12]
MSQIERINFYNTWPNAQRFAAEQQFEEHLKSVSGNFFIPIALNNSLSATGHISLSYTLDSLDSLPMRPDHAFDWIWKAFEHLTKAAAPNLNITDSLRSFATPTICSVLANYPQASANFNQLAENIPLQTARFLLKKIIASGPYTNPTTSFAKRMLYTNGNGPITSLPLQALLDKLSGYNYANPQDRRDGASLIRKAMSGQSLSYPLGQHSLTQNDIVFFLLSGLGYGFRNDRAHASSISPFTSSKARIKTYSHCWFSFLIIYYFLTTLWEASGFIATPQSIDQNYAANNGAFFTLFSSVLNK